MKKLILLGIVLAVALMGWYAFFPQATTDNSAKKFSSQEELNAFVKDNLQSGYGDFAGSALTSQVAKSAEAHTAGAPSEGVQRSADYSGTNIQVEGVDEADIVKTDGKYIYAVSGNKVIVLDAYPAENAKIVSEIGINGTVSEIFINKDRLVVFGQKNLAVSVPEKSSESIMLPRYYSPRTFVEVYDVSDKSSPSLARNISVDGNYYDSRMIGNYVYVIANQPAYNYGGHAPLPVIYSGGAVREVFATDIYYFDIPDSSFIFANILSVNTQNDENPESKTFLMGYSQSMYVSRDNIYIVYQKRVSEFNYYDRIIDGIIMPVVPYDIQNKISQARNSNASKYDKMQQTGRIFEDYLGTLNPEQAANLMKTAEEKAARLQAEIAKEKEKTVIHKISVDGGKIEYKTNGEVSGHVLNQFSMDEYKGYFRVATTTSGNGWGTAATGTAIRSMSDTSMQTAAAETSQIQPSMVEPVPQQPSGPRNHLHVLDGDLKVVGKLEDLAPGERIYSVRFMGEKAYMVTFRQTDPLFVIDLSFPTNPKVLGYLKIPGVSDYLHPYDETHIIGVGRDASEEGRIKGMKLALFDVSDVANPKEVSKYIIGERGTDSEALRDHKAFLFSGEKNLLVVPVSEYYRTPQLGISERPQTQWRQEYWQGAYVFNLDLANGFALKGKITHQNNTENITYYYDWNSQIRRSLFIENVLYTISNKMVKMNSLADLSEINKAEFPAQEAGYPYRIY